MLFLIKFDDINTSFTPKLMQTFISFEPLYKKQHQTDPGEALVECNNSISFSISKNIKVCFPPVNRFLKDVPFYSI